MPENSSRTAIAGLAVCEQAVQLADRAALLARTGESEPGHRAREAAASVRLACELMSATVIYEYERAGSWVPIADALGVGAERLAAECEPALARWRETLDGEGAAGGRAHGREVTAGSSGSPGEPAAVTARSGSDGLDHDGPRP